ncbi:sigma-54-dependent Fis family transcriptional regulator [Pseudonocardia xishanensis]|uniref:Transcriptional regulator MimR n=1 Tax=Pseudonocardia xishanensis TaxID=630995 RepID=A0ABP8RV31_9PSEU
MEHGRVGKLGGRDTLMAWERFRSGDAVDIGPAVRPEILASWQRSDHGRFDPEHRLGPVFGNEVDTDSRLYRAAKDILDDLADKLSDTTTAIFLCDPDGMMIDRRWCDGTIERRFHPIPTEPGFYFSEDVVGTTVAALFSAARRPCYVAGAEHFHPEIHDMSCFAAPVRDPVTCEYVAMLDITCLYREANKIVMPLVISAADAISERLGEDSSRRESLLVQSFTRVKRRSSRPLVCVSNDMVITNAAAARLLHQIDQAVLWEHAFEATRGGGSGRREIPLPAGGRVMADCAPILDGREVIGSSIQLERIRRVEASGAAPSVELPGVEGGSAVWKAACQEVATAVACDTPSLLVGEAGSGKLLLACAAAATCYESVQRVDCGDLRSARDVDELVVSLGSDRGAIVLRHIEHLPAEADHRLADALTGALHDERLVLATAVEPVAGAVSRVAALFGSVITIPPLRAHAEDLPAIVRVLLQAKGGRPVRVGQDALQVLIRYPWPGNVAQVRSVLARLTALSAAPLIGAADLPPWLVAAASRRRLTAMEQAEADAIRQAMRAAGGNKTDAAEQLGISRSTFYRKLRRYGVDMETSIF